jgi:hypothetical protein
MIYYISGEISEPTGLRRNLRRLADRVQAETPQPPVLGKEMTVEETRLRRPGIFFQRKEGG